jgi:antitoxin component HigA of HigAB toxin-antitoxin module
MRIETEEDYRAALREIESLMRAAPNSPEGERLDVLVTLVKAYEHQHFPLELEAVGSEDGPPSSAAGLSFSSVQDPSSG